MIYHRDVSDRDLRLLLMKGKVRWAGNARLMIYGRLDCSAGKRMQRANRVFFTSESEAIAAGYRPCGVCMRKEYRVWKQSRRQQRMRCEPSLAVIESRRWLAEAQGKGRTTQTPDAEGQSG